MMASVLVSQQEGYQQVDSIIPVDKCRWIFIDWHLQSSYSQRQICKRFLETLFVVWIRPVVKGSFHFPWQRRKVGVSSDYFRCTDERSFLSIYEWTYFIYCRNTSRWPSKSIQQELNLFAIKRRSRCYPTRWVCWEECWLCNCCCYRIR